MGRPGMARWRRSHRRRRSWRNRAPSREAKRRAKEKIQMFRYNLPLIGRVYRERDELKQRSGGGLPSNMPAGSGIESFARLHEERSHDFFPSNTNRAQQDVNLLTELRRRTAVEMRRLRRPIHDERAALRDEGAAVGLCGDEDKFGRKFNQKWPASGVWRL